MWNVIFLPIVFLPLFSPLRVFVKMQFFLFFAFASAVWISNGVYTHACALHFCKYHTPKSNCNTCIFNVIICHPYFCMAFAFVVAFVVIIFRVHLFSLHFSLIINNTRAERKRCSGSCFSCRVYCQGLHLRCCSLSLSFSIYDFRCWMLLQQLFILNHSTLFDLLSDTFLSFGEHALL